VYDNIDGNQAKQPKGVETMKKAIVFTALVLIGCGEEPTNNSTEETVNPLVGQWYMDLSYTGYDCAMGLTIDEGYTYEFDYVCLLESGSYGIEAEIGIYQAEEGRIQFKAKQTSCATENYDRYSTFSYSVDDNFLRLVDEEGVIVFEKIEVETSSSALGEFGCWDGLYFYNGPITNL
jgi:hypothetical protein